MNNYKKFPSGELLVSVNAEVESLKIDILSSDDVIWLMMFVDAHYRKHKSKPNLFIGYFAYSRQDRVCNEGEAFSLKVICDLINSLDLPSVKVLEPHSLVLPALLNNCEVISMCILLEELPRNKVILAPDAGAEKRAFAVAKEYNCEFVQALKHRNPQNGEITHIEVLSENLQGKECLIVDDICDGGATFIFLAKKLKEKKCGKISLVVAHGLFTKGLDVFKGVIDEVYCIENFKLTKKEF